MALRLIMEYGISTVNNMKWSVLCMCTNECMCAFVVCVCVCVHVCACTVYIQIFKGRKFCCFRGQLVIHKILILKIS